jgi:hypothetical protein
MVEGRCLRTNQPNRPSAALIAKSPRDRSSLENETPIVISGVGHAVRPSILGDAEEGAELFAREDLAVMLGRW